MDNAQQGWAVPEFNEAVRFLRLIFSLTLAQILTGIAKGFVVEINNFIEIHDQFEGLSTA